MLITLISECEKKALLRTRRVLDAFAISRRAGSLESEKTLNQNINSKTQISSRSSRFIRDGAIQLLPKFA